MPSKRRFLLFCVSVVLALFLLEGVFRAAHFVVRGANSRATVEDAELGWVHNVRRPLITRKNTCGEAVVSRPAPTPNLIRTPQATSGRRVLVIGDSTTHAHEVSTGSAYYDVAEALGHGRFSIWAAGVGGYGNLQEFLLLERVFEDVRPEIVVWQLDENDISNNVYRLDFGMLNNNVMPRPYLDQASGRVELRPTGLWLFRASEAAQFALARVAAIDAAFNLRLIERAQNWLTPVTGEMPALTRQGLAVLDYVIAEAVRRHPATRFAGFSVSPDADAAYGEIFRRHGARYWPGVATRVGASASRTACLPADSHWNVEGNRIAGELLAARLTEL